MARRAKREPVSGAGAARRSSQGDRAEQIRVKREHLDTSRVDTDDGAESAGERDQRPNEKRAIRSRYLALMNTIREERDDLVKVDSEKFNSIFNEVENLHKNVQRPREQVADAEALLDLANTLRTSVKSQSNEGITPADFINGLLKGFGEYRLGSNTENEQVRVLWKDIGLSVSPIFRKCPGCCTMLGPMDTKMKQRKTAVQRKRTRPTERSQPEEVDDSGAEEKTDTDKNMVTMFDVLKKNRRVKLECLMLNRNSFAQTVENLFALSFLVKDGRAQIVVDDKGSHFVLPRNAPAANSVTSGEITYNHFVFRLDFQDWKLMKDAVAVGDELMPHREPPNNLSCEEEPVSNRSQAIPTTPIRKLSRNRGLVIQDESIVEDSPEVGDDDDNERGNAIRKCKRKLR